MSNRVDRIIECEKGAEELQWEAARLIYEELQDGKTQRALAEEIGKSHVHVKFMAGAWKIKLVKPTYQFTDAYREAQKPVTPRDPGITHSARNDVPIEPTESELEQAQRTRDYEDSTEPWDVPRPHPSTPRSVETRVTERKILYDGQLSVELNKTVKQVRMLLTEIDSKDERAMIIEDVKFMIETLKGIIETEEGKYED